MVKLVWKTCIIYLSTDSKLSKEIYVLLAIWVTTKKQNRSFIEKLPHKLNLRVFLAVAKVFKVFLATGLKIQEKQSASDEKNFVCTSMERSNLQKHNRTHTAVTEI